MAGRPETLPTRVGVALAADAPTVDLAALYYECYGQPCHQRPRILHFLNIYLKQNPILALGLTTLTIKLMPYKFKESFKDVSIIVNGSAGPKEVHAGNLTQQDAELIIADGKGHLLQQVSQEEADAAAKAAVPVLSTRTVGDTLTAEEKDGYTQLHELAEASAREKQALNDAAQALTAELEQKITSEVEQDVNAAVTAEFKAKPPVVAAPAAPSAPAAPAAPSQSASGESSTGLPTGTAPAK